MQQRHLPPGRPRADDPVERLLRVDRQAPGQGGQARAQPGDHDPCTGVIEGTCRHLVKDRMDITGACWGLDGAEAVLRLRALISAGDFDTYWTWHLTREHHRTHLTHYQDHTLAA